MRGGEIFVPKLPSIRITDLASSMAPALGHRLVGIRPGEKLHETMCPADDSHLTLEFPGHFVIRPTIAFNLAEIDYSVDAIGERSTPVAQGFEYNSGTNTHFLSVDQITSVNRIALEGLA